MAGGVAVSFSDVVNLRRQSFMKLVSQLPLLVLHTSSCHLYLFVVTSRFIADCAWKSGFWFCWHATDCCCDRVVHEGWLIKTGKSMAATCLLLQLISILIGCRNKQVACYGKQLK